MSQVRLPRSIAQQVEAADEIQRQMQTQTAANPLDALIAPEPAPTPTPAPAPVAAPAPVEPTPQPASAPQPDNWEHKFKTLQGMFRVEVNNQVAANLEQSRQREETLLRSVQQLEQRMGELQTAKPNVAMDPKDVEAFGLEMIEMVRRQASQEIASVVQTALAEINTRLGNLERQAQGLGKSVAMTAEQTFYSDLARMVPDWKQLNTDSGFLDWLGQVDPVYQEPRQTALDRAVQMFSADRAAAVFSAFKATKAPTPSQQANQRELESQVAPSRSASSPAPAETAKPMVSQTDIVKFYDDMRRGVYAGREDYAARIEAGINQAIAEGRVR